jgi:hypothetical protein
MAPPSEGTPVRPSQRTSYPDLGPKFKVDDGPGDAPAPPARGPLPGAPWLPGLGPDGPGAYRPERAPRSRRPEGGGR